MNKASLSKNLYELRQRNKLSQEDFAEKLGVSRQAVSKWERAEAYPDTENLIAISELFGVSIDNLLHEDALHNITNDLHDREEEAVTSSDISEDVREKEINDDYEDDEDDEDDKDDEDSTGINYNGREKYPLFTSFLIHFPYPLLTVIAFFLVGFLADGWYWSWTLFLSVPIYESIVAVARKRRLHCFNFPCLAVFLYLLVGMLTEIWHPTWLVFPSIPIFYAIAEPIDKAIAAKRRTKATVTDKNT